MPEVSSIFQLTLCTLYVLGHLLLHASYDLALLHTCETNLKSTEYLFFHL